MIFFKCCKNGIGGQSNKNYTVPFTCCVSYNENVTINPQPAPNRVSDNAETESNRQNIAQLTKQPTQPSPNGSYDRETSKISLKNLSIIVNVVSCVTDESWKESRTENLSGRYQMVGQIVNDRPAYKRDGKTEDGFEVYLWYDSDWASWLISQGDNFQARNDICWIYIETSERDVIKLGNKWFENHGWDGWNDWRETAKVTIT